MLEKFIEIIDLFFNSFKYAVRDICIFPGKNLVDVFKISVFLISVSLISWFLELPTFIDWKGCILGAVILLIMIVVSNKEDVL